MKAVFWYDSVHLEVDGTPEEVAQPLKSLEFPPPLLVTRFTGGQVTVTQYPGMCNAKVDQK